MTTPSRKHLYDKVELAGEGIDEHSHCQATISEVHFLGHQGVVFRASGKVTGLATAGTHLILARVPAGSYIHWNQAKFSFSRGDVTVEMCEAPTITAVGTPMPSFNTNRVSAIVPTLELYASPTATDAGLVLDTLWTPPTLTGQGSKATGAAGLSTGSEWVLTPDTDYLIKVSNDSGDTITLSYDMLWYEPGLVVWPT